MNKLTTYLQLSPLYPLKGRIATNKCQTNLVTNTPPAGGEGVNKYDNK